MALVFLVMQFSTLFGSNPNVFSRRLETCNTAAAYTVAMIINVNDEKAFATTTEAQRITRINRRGARLCRVPRRRAEATPLGGRQTSDRSGMQTGSCSAHACLDRVEQAGGNVHVIQSVQFPDTGGTGHVDFREVIADHIETGK